MFTFRAPKSVLALITCAMVALPLVARTSEASPASMAAKRAGLNVAGAIKTRWQRVARLDRQAHRRALAKVLNAPRTVFRYVSAARARQVRMRGFDRMSHFTTRAARGRPLSAVHAQQRYGLPALPAKRLTVTLPKGTPVKTMKAHGGARGVGELVNTRQVPRTASKVRETTVR